MQHIARIVLASSLLAGCSAQVLDDLGEVAPPRPCTETVKLFNTFTMRARNIGWNGNKGATPATLTLDLLIYNDKTFPVALSNSGNGVLYAVNFGLLGKDGPVAPKEASGIVSMPTDKEIKQARNPGPFGEKRGKSSRVAKPTVNSAPVSQTRDTNFLIKPNEPQEGRLTFQLPRGNYLLTIERKFADKPSAAQSRYPAAACTISENDASPHRQTGMSGVY